MVFSTYINGSTDCFFPGVRLVDGFIKTFMKTPKGGRVKGVQDKYNNMHLKILKSACETTNY